MKWLRTGRKFRTAMATNSMQGPEVRKAYAERAQQLLFSLAHPHNILEVLRIAEENLMVDPELSNTCKAREWISLQAGATATQLSGQNEDFRYSTRGPGAQSRA